MKQLMRLALISGLMLCPAASMAADNETEIRQMLGYFADQWNEGESLSVKSHFHNSFVLVSSDGVQTKEQRLEEIDVIMASDKDRGELSLTIDQVEMLGDEHAMAYGRSKLKFSDGTELGSTFSSVYIKTPFGWKVILTHE